LTRELAVDYCACLLRLHLTEAEDLTGWHKPKIEYSPPLTVRPS
jgi:hypothetical protein